jgi:cell division protein FtsI (penicillin-binding protein 3)
VPPRRPSGRRSGRLPADRLVALFIVLALGFGGILTRLVLLQVKDAAAFETLARDQRVRTIPLPASRGTIFDRNGEELAMSLPAKAVFADPKLVHDPAREATTVAGILHVDRRNVYRQLTGRGRFAYIARGVDVQTAAALEAAHLRGIGFLNETRRYYPAQALAPQVLGFVGVDGTGLTGLELEYDKLLSGRPGQEVVEEDPSGTLIPQGDNAAEPPVPGDDLILTLDRAIQYQAQTALAAAVKQNHAKGGTVIVMNPATGDILAMASYPWFDPNDFSQAPQDVVRNRAVTDVYEPGSVNKVITAAAALQEGVLNVNTRLMVPDFYQLYTKTFHDAHPHPPEQMTLGDIIAYSSNIGAMKVARMMGQSLFSSYLTRFGLRSRTGSGFPGESPGILPPTSEWSGTSMGTIPIGQGIAVTPLQMTSVYATIANGGVWVQPRFVRQTIGPDGGVAEAAAPESRRVVSESTATMVSRMLAYAVDVGTGTQAQIAGYWVAGKTGTARKPLADGTGYSDKYVASFIGFAPASHPALVVTAILDEPVTEFGGVAAAPLFRDVARFALSRLRVAPAPPLSLPPHAISAG